MTDVASLNAAAQEIAKLTGGVVDYLIVNGAVMLEEPASMSPTDFIGKEQLWLDAMKASIDTNTTGVLFSVNAFLPYIRKSPIKKITVISSGMADTEFIKVAEVSQSVPYSISKAATNVLVAKYAVELRSEGITVLALSPGLVLTAAPSLDDRRLTLRILDCRQLLTVIVVPPEARAGYDWMTNQFQKYEPGFKGPIGPAESIEKCLKVIEGVTVKDSGEFLSHLGNMRWLEG